MTTHMVGDALFHVDVDDAYSETYVLAAPVPHDGPQKTCPVDDQDPPSAGDPCLE